MSGHWQDTYAQHVMTSEQAVELIQSHQRVFLTGNCSVPQNLIDALVRHAAKLEGVELCQPLTVGKGQYLLPELEGHLRVNTLFISADVRRAVQNGKADYTPIMLSQLPSLFSRGDLPIDVALAHLSPPDEDGFCSFGVESGLVKSAIESSRLIIAEINQQMPCTMGDTKIHISKLAAIVESDYPLAELPSGAGNSTEMIENIARHIAGIIPDGATLQLGIGEIPDAVLQYLRDKKDLGIHSELISDGIIRLVEDGIINNSKKSIHTGKITCGFVLGTQKLYRWVDQNPMVELQLTEYVNDPFVIAKNYRMTAINSAIEIDLTGQVCADSIGSKLYSGIGGQTDFIYGASRAEGGLPIIALPSQSIRSDGQQSSKIVSMLQPGAGVTVTRNHVHYVCTEYGIVNLHGKSIRERANLLISIAHPSHREELKHFAKLSSYL